MLAVNKARFAGVTTFVGAIWSGTALAIGYEVIVGGTFNFEQTRTTGRRYGSYFR
jgi:hypothetical protein